MIDGFIIHWSEWWRKLVNGTLKKEGLVCISGNCPTDLTETAFVQIISTFSFSSTQSEFKLTMKPRKEKIDKMKWIDGKISFFSPSVRFQRKGLQSRLWCIWTNSLGHSMKLWVNMWQHSAATSENYFAALSSSSCGLTHQFCCCVVKQQKADAKELSAAFWTEIIHF